MSPEVSDIFSRMEDSKKAYLKTKKIGDEATKELRTALGQDAPRVPSRTTSSSPSTRSSAGGRWARWSRMRAKPNPKLELQLLQAHMRTAAGGVHRLRLDDDAPVRFAITADDQRLLFGGVLIALLGIDTSMALIFTIMIIALPPLLVYRHH